jgi:hypothetical protein
VKIKEIHDALLSLMIRGIGVWLLFVAVDRLYSIANDFYYFVFPQNPAVHLIGSGIRFGFC